MKRIFLIGYMGAGKTTVGKGLANRLKLSFIDLDTYIESRHHKTVREIFEEKGEDAFRNIEKTMLREVAEFEDVLIATGGGAPCFSDNVEFMNSVGTTIYLKVSVKELAARLETCKQTRPVLKNRSGESLVAFISESLEKREPFYSKANVVFDVDKMLTKSDVDNIINALEHHIV